MIGYSLYSNIVIILKLLHSILCSPKSIMLLLESGVCATIVPRLRQFFENVIVSMACTWVPLDALTVLYCIFDTLTTTPTQNAGQCFQTARQTRQCDGRSWGRTLAAYSSRLSGRDFNMRQPCQSQCITYCFPLTGCVGVALVRFTSWRYPTYYELHNLSSHSTIDINGFLNRNCLVCKIKNVSYARGWIWWRFSEPRRGRFTVY